MEAPASVLEGHSKHDIFFMIAVIMYFHACVSELLLYSVSG